MKKTEENKSILIGVHQATLARWKKGSPEKRRLYNLISDKFEYLLKLKKAQEILEDTEDT